MIILAKKKNDSKKNKKQVGFLEKTLPVNVQIVGEESESDIRIYISRTAYKTICDQAQKSLPNESGGLLIGDMIEENGKKNIVISDFIEAKYSETTPISVTFTSRSWAYMTDELHKKYPDKKCVGWMLSQPEHGIIVSAASKFVHDNFFGEGDNVLFIIDPVGKEEGFWSKENGAFNVIKGYYIFDSNRCGLRNWLRCRFGLV